MAKKTADLNLKFKKIYAKAMVEKPELPIRSIVGHEFVLSTIEKDNKGDNTYLARLLTTDNIKIPGRGTDKITAIIATFNHLEDMGFTLNYGQ